ncbi:MAG: hypothetical protein FRC54_02065 [bacterium LCO1.1]|uniref:Transposase TnpC homeodomain domain-containing protein n=1 Tax=Candidatus Weimeria bifida TaxID=2599074 RepID=A0A6N7IWT2_9FIRM|nr:hypothetical protein [Candidatus Weimeria bifida]
MNGPEITDSELNNLPKETIIFLFLQLREAYRQLSANDTNSGTNEKLVKQIEDLTEQIDILTQNRFGRKSETENQIEGQMSMSDLFNNILNEPESLTENGVPPEKDIDEVVKVKEHTRKKGKRKENLSVCRAEIVIHECSKEELDAAFPHGWHELTEDVYSELQCIPAKFKILEHHVKVYGGNHDGDSVIRADHPARILSHSILTPGLFAMIFNMKYVNAIPLNRL